jgi:phosphoribosylformylglycinamidine (FGAM) synthase-like amidotransferase family enzyme
MRKIRSRKKIYVPYFPGTNCEEETMQSFRNAGGKPELLFLNDLLKGKKKITDCDIVGFPGGFSFGDYVDTGIIAAILIREFIPQLVEAKIPTIGICNGFQVLMRAGIFGKGVTLTTNTSGTFCSKPIRHRVLDGKNCLWLRGLEGQILTFPAAHGGGKVVHNRIPNIVMEYVDETPNGGIIAGICSDSGLIFGLMDHPERPPDGKDGQLIFRNGIKAT